METGSEIETVAGFHEHQRETAVSYQVVEMVANDLGVDPVELPPLYETIDPEALDTLFASSSSHGPVFGHVTFGYVGYEITVAYDGEIVITLNDQLPLTG